MVLAKKTNKLMMIELIVVIGCLGLLYLFYHLSGENSLYDYFNHDHKLRFAFILLGGSIIYIIFSLLNQLLYPSTLIKKEVGGIIVYRRKNPTHINYEDIIHVYQRNASGKGIQYSFGTIVIETEMKDYRIPYVANVDQVKTDLLQLINENKSDIRL